MLVHPSIMNICHFSIQFLQVTKQYKMSALSKTNSTESQYSSLYDHNTCHHKNSYYRSCKIQQLCFMHLLQVNTRCFGFRWCNNIKLKHIVSILFDVFMLLFLLTLKTNALCCVVNIWNLNCNFHFLAQLVDDWYLRYMSRWCFYRHCTPPTYHVFAYVSIYCWPMLVFWCLLWLYQSRILIYFDAKSPSNHIPSDLFRSFPFHFASIVPVQTSTLEQQLLAINSLIDSVSFPKSCTNIVLQKKVEN